MELALARVAMSFYTSAEPFGPRMQQPLETFRAALHSAAHIESTTPRPKSLADSLLALLDTLDEVADALTPTDVLFHHISLLSITASSFACVTVENDKPADVVSAAVEEAQQHLQALRAMSHSSNGQLADAAEAFLTKMMHYVNENLKAPLEFVEHSESSSVPNDSNRNMSKNVKLPEHSAPHLVAYRTSVISAVDEFEKTAGEVDTDVAAQASKFCAALRGVYDFVVKASGMKNAPGEEEKQKMLEPIIAEMSAVAEAAAKVGSMQNLFNHFKAVEDAVGMVSWIVAESRPIGFVSDAEAAADFYLNKILVATKKGEDANKHKAFVETLRKIFGVTKAYIKEYHTMGLKYNVGIEAKDGVESAVSRVKIVEEADEEGETYLTAFQALIDGPLAAYVEASSGIDATVAQQAEAFAASWKAEKEFLAKAYEMPPPEDVQPMLAPIAGRMAAVNAIAERVDPHGPVSYHCNAVSESVAALGWVAVDERATTYVGDMAAAGQFFVDKVKMKAKATENPEAHRKWANCLETLFANLKAYVKEYHTQKLVWNPPKVARETKKVAANCDTDNESETTDYVSAFRALADGPLAVYVQASRTIGGEVAEQASAFAAAWNAEAEFLAKAINMPKPDDFQDMLAPIATKMGEVSAIIDKVNPRGPLVHHCNAMSESVAALGWVAVDEKATGYVGDMAGAGQFFLDKVKMGAKKTDNPDSQRAWAVSVETLFAGLKAYVKEHHTQKLVWNPPKVKAVKKVSTAYDEGENAAIDYVTAFKALIDGPLAAYVEAANMIGGEVAKQAFSFAGAWKAEAEFLEKAINTPKPADFEGMLAPIASKIAEVGAIVERIDPRSPIAHHCNAVGESVAALGWVAVDERAASYVGDMAGAGQFFIDKVKMSAKRTDNSEIHCTWANTLETLFAALKVYVKEYHTQKLTWNSSNAVKSKKSPILQK